MTTAAAVQVGSVSATTKSAPSAASAKAPVLGFSTDTSAVMISTTYPRLGRPLGATVWLSG